MTRWDELFDKPTPPPVALAAVDPARVAPYAAAALADEVQKVASAPEGTRNPTLNTAAYSLGQLVGAGHLDHDDVHQRLGAAARSAGLEEGEIGKTLHSGLTAGMREPRQLPEEGVGRTDPAAITVLDADAEVGYRRSWRPVDLTSVLEGSWSPPQPTVGRRADGVGLFYPGKVHTVSSESEGGKTWLMCSAVLDELRAGHSVVYLDFEDDEGGITGRLLHLGADRLELAARLHYLRPEDPIGAGIHSDDLGALLADVRPTLAVVDGVTEAMTLHALDPNDNADAAKFGRLLPRRLAAAGAASVSLDHVTKSAEGRGRYSLGAVHKLNGLDGAAYLLENRTAFGVGITGRSTLKIAKDRPGQLRRHAVTSGGSHWFGDLVLTSHGEGFAEVEVEAPANRAETFRPTVLMGRVMAEVTTRGPLSKRMLRTAVTGKAASIDAAIDVLILDGYLSETTPHTKLRDWSEEAP